MQTTTNERQIEPSSREFPHAMLREIWEQPKALASCAQHYLLGENLNPDAFRGVQEALLGRERIVIAASGSSRHAGLAAEIMLEDLTGLAVDVEYASEYWYRSSHTLLNPCVLVISQSGETADTLGALAEAKARGLSTIAITNREGSSMARTADVALTTWAGKEMAIPATKSFTTQLATLYLLTLSIARLRGRMTQQTVASRCQELLALVPALEQSLPIWETRISAMARQLASARSVLYLGRGIHYAIAREGALKLKESAYVQAEGYPVGELKHGPNALVSPETPLIVLATQDHGDPDSVLRYSKTLQLVRDLSAQKAEVFALVTEGDTEMPQLTPHVLPIPPASEYLLPILEVVPLQMIAYSSAILRGIDVDRPRNLVKAVIQE